MKNVKFSVFGVILMLLVLSNTGPNAIRNEPGGNDFYPSTKPLARWWWFATKIEEVDVKYQLDWAKKMNFGGVEISWIYPLYRYQEMYARSYNRFYPKDTSAQKWLSEDWTKIVAYTKRYADSINLSCDFTYGSAWIVAGLNIEKAHGSQIYGDTSFTQQLNFSWAWPENMTVINHMDAKAFELYSKPMENAMQDVLKGSKSVLFVDSWEIKLNGKNKLWTPGFDILFKQKFGYDIIPFMDTGIDSFPDVRYDYMLLVDEYVTKGFYIPFVNKCKELGAWSRVQCLAAPTDVMSTYGLVDIPESEAMLNNPNYSKIVSSAACLSSKKITSCEAFTCMYGFPSTYLRKEQTADLKMIADALFSQGINQLIYHGMPYNPKGSDSLEFFATTYFGPNGSLTPELPALNAYVEKVSGIMQKGTTYSDIAVYIPFEDGVMKGAYPPERQRVWVWGEYEMRYIDQPNELEGYHPLWINRGFLEKATCKKNKLVVGDAQFSMLYVDAQFMDIRALKKVLALAKDGVPVCLKQNPAQPGKIKSPVYQTMLNQLLKLKNVKQDFKVLIKNPPLIEGDSLPAYWCRQENDGTLYLFLSQWSSKNLLYPVYSGQSFMDKSQKNEFKIYANGKLHQVSVEFKPYQSVVLKITPNGKIEFIDIDFIPKDPIIRPREAQRMNF